MKKIFVVNDIIGLKTSMKSGLDCKLLSLMSVHMLITYIVLQNVSMISKLCQELIKTGKSMIYPLVDKLIRLVLTFSVSIATTERAFSTMKIVKTKLRNKMEDDCLGSYMITYIEKEIA